MGEYARMVATASEHHGAYIDDPDFMDCHGLRPRSDEGEVSS